ncbi:MAG: LacI family transcriptional regulator [Acidobacteria bacterium]|nr:LacI family transcriptional regulator [Acidobacteriota bacterium]
MSARSLQDVAKLAGVSTATVSRVLNGIGVVKESTKLRVQRAVEQLRYHPNMHARALAGGSTRTLGLVVSNLENPFFSGVFHALEREARHQGYEVLVANTDYDPDRLRSAVGTMVGRRVSGLALIVSEIAPLVLDELSGRKIRTVITGADEPRPHIRSVKTQYRRGMERVVDYLYDMGHRRMAFVGHHTSLGPLGERSQAFLDSIRRHGDQVEHRMVVASDGYEGGRTAVREIFASGMRPTAIACVNDYMAIGVLRQLREFNLPVPEAISVTGYDNVDVAEMVNPSLTTVHIPRDLLGRRIFHLLTDDDAPQHEFVVEAELVVRESAGPVARKTKRT